MYQVLQDFTVFVKGSGYVTAGVALIAVVLFWYYLTGGEGRRKAPTKPRTRPRVTK